MASSTNTEVMGSNPACGSCGHRVPITLRDLFWQDPFFSSNWDDFHKIHDEMMSETRSIWNKFDEQLKHVESKSPLPLPEDVKAPGWVFPQKRAHFMRLPSIFNDETSKDMFKINDEQQISVKNDDSNFQISLDTSSYRPDEIKIDINEKNVLTVQAKHEEKSEDGNKHVSRHFSRKYTLPEGCKADTVMSNLSADGVLMITAPKLAIENKRNVPIQQK